MIDDIEICTTLELGSDSNNCQYNFVNSGWKETHEVEVRSPCSKHYNFHIKHHFKGDIRWS